MLAGLFLSLFSSPDRLGLEVPLPLHRLPRGDSALAVRAERLIVGPGKEIANGILLIDHGVVVAVGQDLPIPEGVQVLEGKVACPGFVDPWSSLGLAPGSVQDMGLSPSVRTLDALDPWYLPVERDEALRSGVTAARVQAGRQALFGGLGALVHTEAGEDPAVLLSDACVSGSVGISRGGRSSDVFDRVTEVDRVVGALEKGRRYRESLVDYQHELETWNKAIEEKQAELEKDFKKAKKDREKDLKEAEEKGKEFKEKKYKEDRKPRKPRLDPDDATLARVVDGEVPLVLEVHGEAEIRHLLEATAAFDRLRLVLAGATGGLPFVEQLVERDIPVIVWPTPMGGARPEEYRDHDLALAGELARAGVRVLIGSGGGSDARELRFLAALAVGHGMSPEAALAAITSAPARAFDAAGKVGGLERGCSADVLIFDGDPLDTSAPLRSVVSRGRLIQ